MDKRLIQDLKNGWRNCNSATAGFLQAVPSDKLTDKPFDPRFTTYAWEFACLIRTRYCYLEGLRTGELSFKDRETVPNKDAVAQESKSQILDRLSETSNSILEEIEKIKSAEQVALMSWLLQHERIHHGKLTLYHSKSEYELPDSFTKTWGESNFKKPV